MAVALDVLGGRLRDFSRALRLLRDGTAALADRRPAPCPRPPQRHMTQLPPTTLRLTVADRAHELTVDVEGELCLDTGDRLVDTVSEHLTRRPDVRGVRLNCARLSWIDSAGLSALLMVHRRVGAAGCILRLDDRPALLERMLRQTGTLGHLTALPLQDDDAGGAHAT
ncbi:STAS domain-containing protein [Streptomyces sp. NPDC014006]|uniref:STAS domain-containing protein n=1 Tax=Streptomyces sp. NPDC014006 TaxID=3364870 RepID=UPI0036F68613